ncbi:alpha/beta fold hydrolase [Pontibacillus marinus]|uniref:Proline iminopeptidase n=1 Tax=Pontibacillus marinus BH030004 = DSM 16465 TaxID=1385511 RepID=A0A0A5GED6_9BACI|nr:alpha/beta hydrolase [Pontibacillus marinus]KGX89568.1 proline iminopeptidase [Pontibacillus marinus BH030004 = DSM 16465]
MEVHIDTKNLNLKVKRIGEGEAIIFLQGVRGSELRKFLPYNEALSKDFELIFYEHTEYITSQYINASKPTLQEEVEILNELCIKLGLERVHLFGESWGTILALLYAIYYPHQVQKIFLTGAIGASYESFALFESEMLKRSNHNDIQKFLELAESLSQGEDTVDSIFHMLDPYYVYSSQVTENTSLPMNEIVNNEIGASLRENFDIRKDLSQLAEIPILVAQGTYDIISPEGIQSQLIDYLPQATLVEIEEAGHWTIVDQSEKILGLAKTFFSENQAH